MLHICSLLSGGLEWNILGAALRVIQLRNVCNLFGASNVLVHVQQLFNTRSFLRVLPQYKLEVLNIDFTAPVADCGCLDALTRNNRIVGHLITTTPTTIVM